MLGIKRAPTSLTGACLKRAAMFLLGLTLCLGVPAQTQVLPPPDPVRQEVWGDFGALAGNDYYWCHKSSCDRPAALLMFRWLVRGKLLLTVSWQGGFVLRKYIQADETGRLTWTNTGPIVPEYFKAIDILPGGDVRLSYSTHTETYSLSADKLTFATTQRPLIPGTPGTQVFFNAESAAAPIQLVTDQFRRAASIAPPGPGDEFVMFDPQPGPPVIRSSGKRVALIVGVDQYAAFGGLANASNDARSIAAALGRIGFVVDLLINPDLRAFKQAVSRLGRTMNAMTADDVGLFYFAGHGVQTRGINYLLPANAQVQLEADLDLEGVAADAVLRQMEEGERATRIVILDACRNMPILRSSRSPEIGLARMEAPRGSFIAYATAPGSVAFDGPGRNSPFTAALVNEMLRPGQPIESVFRNVRRAVLASTDGRQTTWDSSSLSEPFYFVQPGTALGTTQKTGS
jgi:hypothetical protein